MKKEQGRTRKKKKILQVKEVIEELESKKEEEISLDWIGEQFKHKDNLLEIAQFKLRNLEQRYRNLEKHYIGLKTTVEKGEKKQFIFGLIFGVAFSLAGLFFFYLSSL